jgi:hypothetical protein
VTPPAASATPLPGAVETAGSPPPVNLGHGFVLAYRGGWAGSTGWVAGLSRATVYTSPGRAGKRAAALRELGHTPEVVALDAPLPEEGDLPEEERVGRLGSPDIVRGYVLGNTGTAAAITVVGKASGERRTFRFRRALKARAEGAVDSFFLDLLSGPDNIGDYTPLAELHRFPCGGVSRELRRTVGESSVAARLAGALALTLTSAGWRGEEGRQAAVWAAVDFWHDGRCGRCSKGLTVPESVERGLGPECAGRVHGGAVWGPLGGE